MAKLILLHVSANDATYLPVKPGPVAEYEPQHVMAPIHCPRQRCHELVPCETSASVKRTVQKKYTRRPVHRIRGPEYTVRARILTPYLIPQRLVRSYQKTAAD
ncbi:hypothetical protein CCM_04123 [Cordyceps militaris CM01]|uniref:Uncharacterized protein n=1 Tax=Cordyceps militaris (strain CM01) TaxID=983644 RepID=G3JDS5_CORMM|nr:uncharacterized protein CCM_04123 [Cordyceps militaris CM01]EGX92750.1 hypothetical protein CCM_04123 [Cordyceps militaris CM01]